jgi:hypothetical protein
MTSQARTPLFVALLLLAGTAVACSGAVASPNTQSDGADITAGQSCSANPPVNARCASACELGFAIIDGHTSCACCTASSGADAGSDADAGGSDADAGHDGGPAETCGGPPPNARCMACPGPNGYKQIDGKPTCECCSH